MLNSYLLKCYLLIDPWASHAMTIDKKLNVLFLFQIPSVRCSILRCINELDYHLVPTYCILVDIVKGDIGPEYFSNDVINDFIILSLQFEWKTLQHFPSAHLWIYRTAGLATEHKRLSLLTLLARGRSTKQATPPIAGPR